MNASYRDIFKAASLFGGVRAVNYLINLVRTKFVAVLLGTTGVGLNSIYDSTRNLLYSAASFGLDAIGIKDISQRYEEFQAESRQEERTGILSVLVRNVCAFRSWTALLAVFGIILTVILSGPLSRLTFQDYEHVTAYLFLAPIVGLSTFILGETAILQGMRKLRWVAAVSVITTAVTTLVSVPIYFFLHLDGIIPALICVYVASALIVISFSYKLFPPQYDFSKKTFGAGMPMLRVGFSIVAVNVIASIIELLVKSVLNAVGSLDTVGLYNTNETITKCFAAFFIASIVSDYYPRLSGVVHNQSERTATVRKQSEFLLLVTPPAIILLIFSLPFIVPLLLSTEFSEVIPLTRVASVAIVFEVAHLPYSYIPLAAGDSKTYLSLGLIQASDLILIIPGYYFWGLTGIGLMFLIANIVDFVMALHISKHRYGVSMSGRNRMLMTVQTMFLVSAYFCASCLSEIKYIASAILLTIISLLFSYCYYRHEFGQH